MAGKKKKTSPNAGSPFKNNPFRQLKGFVVPEEERRPEPEKPTVEPVQGEEEVDFLAAMSGLGVARIDTGEHPEPVAEAPGTVEAPSAEDERQLFLDALGSLEVRFEDDAPEDGAGDDSLPSASPRRIRQLVRGKLRVEARLDLHGCTRDEALEKFDHFLSKARHHGWTVLLVITGKGHHSQEGPVLREAIERRLRLRRPEGLLEWQRAPRQFGGDGALVLFFRSRSAG